MTIITERTAIAKALNFGKYPVITMEVSESKENYGEIYEGTQIKVWNETKVGNFFTYAKTYYFGDCKKVIFMEGGGGACLKAGFGYHDIMEMIDHAHSVELKPEQEVIVIFTNKKNGKCSYPILTKTTKFNRNYSDVMQLDGEFEEIIRAVQL